MTPETRTFRHLARRRWPLFAVCGSLALASMMGLLQSGPAGSQPPIRTDGRVIDHLYFEGLKTVDSAYLLTVVRIPPGSVWNRDEIAAAAARLAETGKFEGNPYAEPREEDGKLALVFVVKERPFVIEISITGNKKFSTNDLLKEVELSVGSPISEFLINQTKQQIERKYKEAGYYHVAVDVDGAALRNEQRVLIRIAEGPRVKVRHIIFEGNASFTPSRLREQIETTTYIWLFRTGAFDDETAKRDVAALKKFYMDRGFLNAQVGYRIHIADNQENLTLTFQIEEGLEHFIRSIKYVGNNVFNDDKIASIMSRTYQGAPIDADILKADREKLTSAYGEQGYVYSEVTTTHVFSNEEGFVDLTVDVIEKAQYRFGRIDIRGNRRTKDKVVRRELRFYPEQLYNTVAAKEAEGRLVETRLFSEATITPQGDMPAVRDALVEVSEADTTSILFGVGVTSNNGVIGSISIENRNFDIFDWPRTTAELFKGRAFKGAGQTMKLQLEPGTELNRARIDFREPYLLDQDIGLGLGAYIFERSRDDYNEQRIGFYASLDKRFREGLLKGWAVEGATRFERIDISDVDWLAANDIKDVKGDSWLTSLKPSIVHDTTDSSFMPSKGYRFKVSYEQAGALGGDYTFGKLIAEHQHYFTLHKDIFDRKHIFQVGASAGQIFGDAPVFEKFYAGGIGSIRGFEFRGISPRDGVYNDAVGGDFMLLTNAEYSFPLMGKVLRGVMFSDMGTVRDSVGLSTWRSSVGVGARLYIKYFGPIPLAFDLAWPVSKDDQDDTQVFSFSFGTTF
jgi:outer membrane protein insertion porin family